MNVKHNFDLEERTYKFAKEVRLYFRNHPISNLLVDDIKQVIRSSGSVGANYLEANDSLGKKDFLMRMKIARKEAKESVHYLRLIKETREKSNSDIEITRLIQEGIELKRILSAIIKKFEDTTR